MIRCAASHVALLYLLRLSLARVLVTAAVTAMELHQRRPNAELLIPHS